MKTTNIADLLARAEMDGWRAPDARRMLSEERQTVMATTQIASGARAKAEVAEARAPKQHTDGPNGSANCGLCLAIRLRNEADEANKKQKAAAIEARRVAIMWAPDLFGDSDK